MACSLTLCTVSFHSGEFIELNERLTRSLNPDADVRWIVAENSPPESPARVELRDRPEMMLVEGVNGDHRPTYHHTLALAKCIDRARTRFVAVIDPDLFVVRRNWVSALTGHIQQRGLSFIGVPWHPQSSGKYRYFPAVHFCVFDLERFPKQEIDFRPDHPDVRRGDPRGGDTEQQSYFTRSVLAGLLGRLPRMAARRQYYTDTGSRFYKKWVDAPNVRYETLDPVWDPDRAAGHFSALGRIAQRVLPDELTYYPKHYKRVSDADFVGQLSGTTTPEVWECFLWLGQPFCVHVRGNIDRETRGKEHELGIIRRLAHRLQPNC